MDLPLLQNVFAAGGVVQIPEFVEPKLVDLLALRTLELADTHGLRRDGYPSRGGRALLEILDGFVVQEHFPELTQLYSDVRALAEIIVKAPVVLSPYPRSGINIRVYRQAGSGDGWHYDSNPLSGLLYLTTGGQPTQFKITDTTSLDIYPVAGLLLLFDGRRTLHYVPTGNQLRITCPLNLYYPHDLERPAYVDRVLFENSDANPHM
jgi:hypothetical protein